MVHVMLGSSCNAWIHKRCSGVSGKLQEVRDFCCKTCVSGGTMQLEILEEIYRACVQKVLVYGSETWPVKEEDTQRLERTERMMVRWMCGTSLNRRISSRFKQAFECGSSYRCRETGEIQVAWTC